MFVSIIFSQERSRAVLTSIAVRFPAASAPEELVLGNMTFYQLPAALVRIQQVRTRGSYRMNDRATTGTLPRSVGRRRQAS